MAGASMPPSNNEKRTMMKFLVKENVKGRGGKFTDDCQRHTETGENDLSSVPVGEVGAGGVGPIG